MEPTGSSLAPGGPSTATDALRLPVFAYGTLLDELFVSRLLEHPVSSEPARLDGYRVETLPAFDWPVLVHDAASCVEGRVYRGLDREDLRRLDLYEGTAEGLYRRVGVPVVIEATDAPETAWTYLPTPKTLRRLG